MIGKKARRASILTFVIGFLLIAVLFAHAGVGETLAALANVRLFWALGMAFLFVQLEVLTIALRWYLLLGKNRKGASLWSIFLLILTGLFVNSITPGPRSGGEPVRAYLLNRMTGAKKRRVLASAVAGSYVMTVVFFILSLVSFVSILTFWKLPPTLHYGSIIGLAFIFLVGLPATFLIFFKQFGRRFIMRIVDRLMPWVMKRIRSLRAGYKDYPELRVDVKRVVDDFFETTVKISRDPLMLFMALLLSFLAYFFTVLKTAFVLLAFGINIPIVLVLVLAILPELLGMICWLPGGIGVTEVSFAVLLMMMVTISPAKASAVMIMSRLLSYWYFIIAGFICTTFLWHRILHTSKKELWAKS